MVVILSSYFVILNEVKNLSFNSNTERQEKQILRFAQDDRWGRSD